ncbi:hypothetical protein HOL34_00100 [bacterium]|nr:hypothetical protein [bacterium]
MIFNKSAYYCALLCVTSFGHLISSSSSRINKISNDLYESKIEDDLYFVMERLSHKNHYKWEMLIKEWMRLLRLDYKGLEKMNLDGVGSFLISIKYFDSADVWIAYASNKFVKTPRNFNEETVEMAMTVTTSSDAPLTTHMGISRSPFFQATYLRKNKKQHKRISAKLHSFAANVSIMRDASKKYMITRPAPKMRELLGKAFPNNSYIGDSHVRNLRKDYIKNKGYIENPNKHFIAKQNIIDYKETINKCTIDLAEWNETIEKRKQKLASIKNELQKALEHLDVIKLNKSKEKYNISDHELEELFARIEKLKLQVTRGQKRLSFALDDLKKYKKNLDEAKLNTPKKMADERIFRYQKELSELYNGNTPITLNPEDNFFGLKNAKGKTIWEVKNYNTRSDLSWFFKHGHLYPGFHLPYAAIDIVPLSKYWKQS